MFEARKDRLRQRQQGTGDRYDAGDELDDRGVTEAEQGSIEAEKLKERHDQLITYLDDERDRQAENRYQMAKDADFKDSLQWEPEDAEALMARGQAPLVFNKVRPTIEWVTGTEKRTRIDFKILPREQGDEQGAEVKTKVLKYLSDVNRTPFARSAAFDEAVTCGLSWLEDGITTDPDREMIYSGHETWRNVYHDSRDRSFDSSMSRYLFRQRTLDTDVVKAMFPSAATHIDTVSAADSTLGIDADDVWYLGEQLTNAQQAEMSMRLGARSGFVSGGYGDMGRRSVVRVIEAWYRIPEAVQVFANGPFAGKAVDTKDPGHAQAMQAGATTFSHVRMVTRCMICTESAPLWDGRSWYRHNRFPFTPVWCYRRARDGMPYGIVRGIRDPQEDLNKRRSKALYIMSVNRVVADEDAVDDPEQLREEASRADGVILKKRGTEIRFEKALNELSGNWELMQHDESMIQDMSGVTSELLGKQTNADSGKAILARQEQGSMVTASIFDQYRFAVQRQGEIQLSLIEEYMTAQRVLRIVGNRKPIEWVPINAVTEDGRVINDITARQADFVVSEQDYRANMQQAAFEQLGDMLTKVAQYAPQVVVNLLDLLVELAEIPNKDEFVARIRKITGQSDPTKPPTPEEQQAQAQAQQKAQLQEQLQMQTLQAQLEELQGKAKLVGAKAVTEHVTALLQSINAGVQVAQVPGVAAVADEIARSSGFQDQGGADPNIPQAQAPAIQQPAPAAPAVQ